MREIINVEKNHIINKDQEELDMYKIDYKSKGVDYSLHMAENTTNGIVLMISDLNGRVIIINNDKFHMSILELAKASI